MKNGGVKGGLSPAWNKGKTKENDSRLADQSSKISGENNLFLENDAHKQKHKFSSYSFFI